MRWLYLVSVLLSSTLAVTQMMRNDSVGNDPARERLCALRAKINPDVKTEPFEIDSSWLKNARSGPYGHPDATFIAVSGYLVECFLRPGTGRFEPDSWTGETSWWHLIKPKQFQPGYFTNEGTEVASSVCLKAASSRTSRPDFDHSMHWIPGPANPGVLIGGKKAELYDVVLKGKLFYRAPGMDLAATEFTCLLSPMLEFKAIQFK